MTSAAPPIWFLDVDGVVNALRPRTGLLSTKAITAGRVWPIHWSAEVVRVINTCHATGLAEVRWLTTWEQDAHLSLAPAVGLDAFVAYDIPAETGRHGWWKADVVADVVSAEGRPFIWTDDDLASEDVDELVASIGVDHLLVSPASEHGLRSSELRDVIAFLSQFAVGRPSGGAS